MDVRISRRRDRADAYRENLQLVECSGDCILPLYSTRTAASLLKAVPDTMRTSRPMKRPPRPLLSTQPDKSSKSDRKGKGKARQQDAAESGDVYSYSLPKRGKGAGRAEQRLKGAKKDVSESYSASASSSKGKRRANEDSDLDDEDAEDGAEGSFAADDFAKYKDIKFKFSGNSDDEGVADGGQFDEDDEEIDSDMAGTDTEEESSEDDRPKKKSVKSKKRSVRC